MIVTTKSKVLSSREKPMPFAIDESGIPEELKNPKRWLGWRWVWDAKNKKWNKPPVEARTGRMGSSTNSQKWCSFSEAIAAVKAQRCDGIGFVLGEADGIHFSGIDLDDCRNPETAAQRPAVGTESTVQQGSEESAEKPEQTDKFDYDQVFRLYQQGERDSLILALLPCLRWFARNVFCKIGVCEPWERPWREDLISAGTVTLIELVDRRLQERQMASGKNLVRSIRPGIMKEMFRTYEERFVAPHPPYEVRRRRLEKAKKENAEKEKAGIYEAEYDEKDIDDAGFKPWEKPQIYKVDPNGYVWNGEASTKKSSGVESSALDLLVARDPNQRTDYFRDVEDSIETIRGMADDKSRPLFNAIYPPNDQDLRCRKRACSPPYSKQPHAETAGFAGVENTRGRSFDLRDGDCLLRKKPRISTKRKKLPAVAKQLNIPESTARDRMRRLRKKVKEKYAQDIKSSDGEISEILEILAESSCR